MRLIMGPQSLLIRLLSWFYLPKNGQDDVPILFSYQLSVISYQHLAIPYWKGQDIYLDKLYFSTCSNEVYRIS